MSKQKNKGCLSFIGNNATEVTGSCTLVEYNDSRILVDCGLRQSSKEQDDHKINMKLNKYIKPNRLDGVILSHVHIDHCGKIPLLFKHNCNCPIYIPKGSKGLLTLMLNDTAKIFKQDHERKGIAMPYEQHHVDEALNHCIEVELYTPTSITNDIKFTLYNAQHIPFSSSIYIECTDGNTLKKIGFTGDFSNYESTLFLKDLDALPHVDILVSECTYSEKGRVHKSNDRKKDMEKLDVAIREAKSNKGKVVLPLFSNTRFQSVLTSIYEYYDGDCPLPILCDSKLAHNISSMWSYAIDKDEELWTKVYSWDKVRWVKDAKERMNWIKLNESYIVLASGGFLNSGSAIPYVQNLLGSSKNRIVFCGYSSEDSVAGKIKAGKQKTIKIDGKTCRNNAKVVILNSFSSHADYNELMDYLTEAKYNSLYLVHSEQESKGKFAEELRHRLSKANRTDKVIATVKEQRVHF